MRARAPLRHGLEAGPTHSSTRFSSRRRRKGSGADLDVVSDNLAEALRLADDDVYVVRSSDWINELSARLDLRDQNGSVVGLVDDREEERIRSYLDAGNAIRRMTASGAAVAHAGDEVRSFHFSDLTPRFDSRPASRCSVAETTTPARHDHSSTAA